MATINSLPNEILLDIVQNLIDDKSDLCALALVNKNFSSLAQTFIMRDIDLAIDEPQSYGCEILPSRRSTRIQQTDSYGASCDDISKTYDSLMRSIQSAPHLTSYVTNITLRWNLNSSPNPLSYAKRVHEKADSLLENFPNLEKLSTRSRGLIRTLHQTRDRDRLARLTEIDMANSDASLGVFIDYMTLPAILRLSVGFINPPFTIKDEVFGSFKMNNQSRAPLRFLDLGLTPIPHSIASRLLELRPEVLKLWMCLPGYMNLPVRWPPLSLSSGDGVNMSHALSPSSIQPCISVLQSTLVELRLFSSRLSWRGYDGSRMDLSQFTALEILHAPNDCFFPASHPEQDRQGILGLLPMSLKQLHVSFERESYFFFKPERNVFSALSEVSMSKLEGIAKDPEYLSRYAWVKEILLSKHDRLPNLGLFSIKEEIGAYLKYIGAVSFPAEGLFTDLCGLAIESKIEMQITLRYKKPERAEF